MPERMSGADWLDQEEEELEDLEHVVIDVFAPNWDSVQVFRLCELTVVGGFNSTWHGISARELESACRLRGIPRSRREEIAEDVRYMGSVVAAETNRRIQEQLERQKRKQQR